jgi:lysophospholipase L1-like esterase
MRKVIALLALILPALGFCQTKVIAVIGSSTAAGFGASVPDSAWVNRAVHYWQGQGFVIILHNLAVASTTSYAGMPTDFVPPSNRDTVDPEHNITMAMSFNPDLVFIAYPSNDIGKDYTNTEYLFNLRTMASVVTSAGKVAYVTSTQPRDAFNAAEVDSLVKGRDSIMAEFTPYGLNFFDSLADPVTHLFKPALTDGGVHPNDAGHRLLFEVVQSNVVLPGPPLPLRLTGIHAFPGDHSILLQWTTAGEQAPTHFEIQRSLKGASFATIGQAEGKGSETGAAYSWSDDQPQTGDNFYRLHILTGAGESYSPVVSAAITPAASGLIGKIFQMNGSLLNLELSIPPGLKAEVSVYSASGIPIKKQSVESQAGFVTVPLPGLAPGIYFVTVTTSSGQRETKAFHKF